MSVWRRRALQALPEFRLELSDPHEVYSSYSLWFLLLEKVREAHRNDDADLLTRIYDLATWCFRAGPELSNAVAVSFYEHLFDQPWMRPLVPAWLPPDVVRDCAVLWESRLSDVDWQAVRRLIADGGRS